MALLSGCQDYMDLEMHYFAYDIACQYSRNFYTRMKNLAGLVRDFKSLQTKDFDSFHRILLVWAVGKFHLAAHKADCRFRYSLRYIWGSGRTDGEADEREWAVLNTLAQRAREMAAGHRHDTINDFLDALNARRTASLR